jgi:hypothetical protein
MRPLRPEQDNPLARAKDSARSIATEVDQPPLTPASSTPLENRSGTADSSATDPSDKHLILRQTSLLRVIAEFIEQRTLPAGYRYGSADALATPGTRLCIASGIYQHR